MYSIEKLYYSEVSQKLAYARQLFDDHGSELLKQTEIKKKLTRLDSLSLDLQKQMGSMIMGSLCKICASKPEGGCCSAFMAGETDAVLLLINMLLGIDVKPRRDDDFECCYLSLAGCTLKIKPMFCLNYNCRHILTGNEALDLNKLDKAASAVLGEQTALEEILLKTIRLQ